MQYPEVEICLVDRSCLLNTKSMLDFPCLLKTSTEEATQKMEEIADEMFHKWEWKTLNFNGVYPNGIVDLETGDVLIFR